MDAVSIVFPIFATANITSELIIIYFGDYSYVLRNLPGNSSKSCLNWAKSVFDNPELNIPILDSTRFVEAFRKNLVWLLLSFIIYLLLTIVILHVNYLSNFNL